MKTFFKILAGLIVVIIAAVAALLIFIDPNDYKEEIQAAARDKADIDLKIGGDMALSIFPTFALELPQVEATSLKPAESPLQSAKLKQASVSVSILALLGGELKMNGLLLDGLDLTLQSPSETKADSTNKTQAPAASATDTTSSNTASSGTVTASNDSPKALKLNLGDVSIRDARIEYTDRKTGQRIVLSDFNFSGEEVNSAEPFNLNSGFTLEVFQKQQTSADINLKGELKTELFLDTLNQLFKANDLDFKLDLQTAALGSKPVPLQLKGDIAADLASDQASMDKLVLEVAGLKLNADIKVAQMSSAPKLSGELEIEPFALNPLLKTLNQAEVKTTDDKVLQTIGLKAKLTGPANVLELSDLELRLDDTRFTGLISHNLNTGAQIVKLQGDRIDVDRYLPPTSDESAAATTNKTKSASGADTGEGRYSKAPLLPIDTLQSLNIDSTLGLTELKVSGLTVTKLQLLTNAKGGLIKVPQISGDFYQGAFNSNATIDARKEPVTINLEKNINGIKLGGLLQDLMDKKMFSGTFNMNGKYQTEGNSIYDIVHTIDGNMKMNLQDGRLEGVNLTDKLCSGILQLQGKSPNDSAVDYTEFSNLNGSVNIVNGVADNRDLKASMVGVGLTGAGKVNLPKENFDYGLSLTILQELKGPNCSIDNKLHNLALPLRCAGGFNDDPAKMCGIDKDGMKKVFADMGGKELQEKADKEKARLKEKVEKEEDRLKDKLKGLFGG